MEKASSASVAEIQDVEGLRRRHQELERRLSVLDRHLSLTSDEQLERVRLKKEKLWLKDRILVLDALAGAPAPGRTHS